MLYAYGRSLFESGDFSGAINALTRSLTLAQGTGSLKREHASFVTALTNSWERLF